MKKLSKKQKLIMTIAIILILIIIAIVYTTNIISNNSQIENEGYFATTTNASSNLIASYIKKGVKVGGITGTLEVLDTSDADATAEDIAWGKTGYVNGIKITGTRIDTVAQAKESQQAFSENKILIDDYGNNVKVPAGFKISEDSATSVTGGVVIEDVSAPGKTSDTKGSQFVWIPVGDVLTDTNGSTSTIKLGRYTFDDDGTKHLVQSAEEYANETQLKTSSNASEYFQELYTTSSENAKAKDIKAFVTKTLVSHGYYLGRFEAGDATATEVPREDSADKPIVCKARVYPYNYGTQLQASNLSQRMYSSSNFESDLINSYAWDTAIVFIQTFSGDTNYSMQKGANTNENLQKCGESILKFVDSGDEAQDVRCNIYDMAGNCYEWTTEKCSNENYPYVARGGFYFYEHTVSHRGYTSDGTDENFTFRPILYL